ncbi:hypothetical protein CIW54_10550 [Paraburkholderia sp. T12-10]|nr:hypothetical protein CIW54_10550 [Paraburkholderia sp. T12-10]
MTQHRITSVRFTRYKAFENFQISLQDFNVLVGSNNAGKSTIIGAFRILAEGMRRARAKKAEPLDVPGFTGWGHRLNIGDLPIASENIFFDYDDSKPAQVIFRISNGNHLKLHFPEQGSCYLIADSSTSPARTPTQFKASFDVDIGFVPVLGPVEQREPLYAKEAARLALLSSGASRNFRNIWFHYPDGFGEFKELVQSTWPGMDIDRPTLNGGRELAMFCPEDRYPREICWTGYGFQVWCQMLTHIVKAKAGALLVIDEPDIYLHSDLQRQLVSLLRELGPDVLIATHSTEIIAECEPTSLLNVNKRNTSAKRVKDVSQLKRVFSALGSNLNPTLTQLAKTKRAVFVEGLDFQVLGVFARVLGYQRVANRVDFAVVKTQGFNPKRAVDLAAGIDAAVGSPVARAVVLDRDYRSDAEIGEVIAELEKHNFSATIHGRKEIENYLLHSPTIRRAVEARLAERTLRSGGELQEVPDIDVIIDDAIEELRHEVFAQLQAREAEFLRKKSPYLDQATVTADVLEKFEKTWATKDGRLSVVPGKDVLAKVNSKLQEKIGVSVSDGQIAAKFRASEVHPDVCKLIETLSKFGLSQTKG